ncbi:MAG: hypothetical protein ACJAYU_003367 [Bradymonadia bacterium]|jgi:hypothetical protein
MVRRRRNGQGEAGGFFLLDGNGGTTTVDPVAAENFRDLGSGISEGIGHPAGEARLRGSRIQGRIRLNGSAY